MTKKKVDTSGMKDMFEEATKETIARIELQIKEKQKELESYTNSENNCDSGLGDIEDRAIVNALNNEIRALQQQLSEYQK